MTKFCASICLSLALAWILGAIFLTSPTLCRWNEALGLPVPVSGTLKQEREENWTHFRYGALGLEANDAQRSSSAEPKVLIFGDSYIEADMVNPAERIQACITEMGIPAVGVGVSGNSCVEYHYLMGIYNKAISNVATNVILIADISDILPPKRVDDFKSLKPAFPFRKMEGRIGELSYRLRLMAFRNILKRARTAWHDGLDFSGNQCLFHVDTHKGIKDTSHYEAYWHSMLDALKSQAPKGRLMIVYAPIVPSIRGNAISHANDDKEVIRRFTQVANSYNIIGGVLLM